MQIRKENSERARRNPGIFNRVRYLACMLFLPALIFAGGLNAQQSPAETAKAFMRSGDYSNAILVLKKAVKNDRNNLQLKKDLAFAYYLHKDYSKALFTIKPVTESREADIQSFQILGMVYKATGDRKEAEKMYRAGLK